jgi:hypothetical protein
MAGFSILIMPCKSLTLRAVLLGGFAALAHASSVWSPALRHEPLNVLEVDPVQNATFLFKTTSASITFHGFEMYSKDIVAAMNIPAACKTSLRNTVDCSYYVQRFRSPAYRGTPGPTGNLSSICDTGCASSLKAWISDVRHHCQGHNISNANPTWPGASMLQGVRETCQTDESGKKYCNGDLHPQLQCPMSALLKHLLTKQSRQPSWTSSSASLPSRKCPRRSFAPIATSTA